MRNEGGEGDSRAHVFFERGRKAAHDGHYEYAIEMFLTGLSTQLRGLSEAIRDQYQQLPPMPQPMWGNSSGGRQ